MKKVPYYDRWPEVKSSFPQDPQTEAFVDSIVAQMTPEEKVGQMIQPDIRQVTPAECEQFKLGSVLNGGGGWVNEDKHAPVDAWLARADEYWFALERAYEGRPFRVPYMWGTDAVHGHNNIFGATIFPHNIGLGAAGDCNLIYNIARATATEIAVTGMDWTFAPTVATPRDRRWGRHYEGYSEDPTLVYNYSPEVVAGLQGTPEQLKTDQFVLSNVKHWLGDGGTNNGVDRGQNHYSETLLRNIHGPGYFSGLDAGSLIVMASFSTWEGEENYDLTPNEGAVYNKKMTGSHYLISEVLKDQMGFEGLVISDWNSHAEVSKCSNGNANYAVKAGIDIVMVTAREDWQAVYYNIISGVQSGEISQSRIDDACRRILRVKARAGLWQKLPPSRRTLAGRQDLLSCSEHLELAREAVRKSLVLLKNNQVLPLSPDKKYLVLGSAADDITKQTGGWTLTWGGEGNTAEDFPGGKTLLTAISDRIGADQVIYQKSLDKKFLNSEEGRELLSSIDGAILVFGEDPTAEMLGDIKPWQTLEFSQLKHHYQQDLLSLKALKAAGISVTSVFYSGRPLYINEELNASDAFIAAWFPGTQGEGITDLLFPNDEAWDFTGSLSFSWPARKDSYSVNQVPQQVPNYQVPDNELNPEGKHKPLFPLGYGLSLKSSEWLGELPLDSSSPTTPQEGASVLNVFGVESTGDFVLKVADEKNWMGLLVSGNNPTHTKFCTIKPIDYRHQQDGRQIICAEQRTLIYCQSPDQGVFNLDRFAKHEGHLKMTMRVHELQGTVGVGFQVNTREPMELDISSLLAEKPKGEWCSLSIPLALLPKQNYQKVNTPIVLACTGHMKMDLGSVSWQLPDNHHDH